MILTLEDFFEEAFSFVQEPRANQRRHQGQSGGDLLSLFGNCFLFSDLRCGRLG